MQQGPNSWLQKQANLHPHRPALYWKNKSWSFAVLQKLTQQYAHFYQKELPKGCQRIALYGSNTPQLYLTILALWELGCEIQFLNTRLTASEITFQLQDAQTTTIVGDITDLLPDQAIQRIHFPNEDLLTEPATIIDLGYQLEQTASIMYTSGTTGSPKGVPQTFANHLASAQATHKNLVLTLDDCWYCALPLFHISGLSIMLRSLALGISVRLSERFEPKEVAKSLYRQQFTVISAVTKMLHQLIPYLVTAPPKHFRYCLLGGGPCDVKTLATCKDLQLPVIQSFGMTETCSQVTALSPQVALEKLGSSGRPLGDTQIQIHAPNQKRIGEIWLKGASIVTHYLNNRSSGSWTTDGWFKTGDIGYLDEDNYLTVKSRQSELIISGGENIYPAEIEAVLLAHPAVKEAIVVGEENPVWGQRPIVYVVLKANHYPLERLHTDLTQHLAKYKLPDVYYQVALIHKTASGKPLKRWYTQEENDVERRKHLEQEYRPNT